MFASNARITGASSSNPAFLDSLRRFIGVYQTTNCSSRRAPELLLPFRAIRWESKCSATNRWRECLEDHAATYTTDCRGCFRCCDIRRILATSKAHKIIEPHKNARSAVPHLVAATTSKPKRRKTNGLPIRNPGNFTAAGHLLERLRMDFQEGRSFFRIEKPLTGRICVGPLDGLRSKHGHRRLQQKFSQQ